MVVRRIKEDGKVRIHVEYTDPRSPEELEWARTERVKEAADKQDEWAEARLLPREGRPPGELLLTNGSDIVPSAVEWVWVQMGSHFMIAGELNLLAGKGSSGKSLLGDGLAARATRGELNGSWRGIPCGVGWVTLEASKEQEVAPRLIANGADMSRVWFMQIGSSTSAHLQIFDPAYIEDLRTAVREKDLGFLFLDPLLDSLDKAANQSEQNAVREALAAVMTFAREENVTIVGLAHFNKMTTVPDAVDRITGSAAFSQRIRSVLACAYDVEDKQHIVESVKANEAPQGQAAMTFSATPIPMKDQRGHVVEDSTGRPGTT